MFCRGGRRRRSRKTWPPTFGGGGKGNCLLWGARVIVPRSLQPKVLDEIHEGHPGISRVKSFFARSYVWWPTLNSDLEAKVRTCTTRHPNAAVGLARETLDTHPRGPCWPIYGEYPSHCRRCLSGLRHPWSPQHQQSSPLTSCSTYLPLTGSLRSLSLTTAQPSL